jgi:DNA-binding beta-propeller fold protein YncE
MSDLILKTGDTFPPLVTTLEENGSPLDLTGADSVTMRMSSGNVSLTDLACDVVGDPTNGIVEYDWEPGDTDTPGTYKVDFLIDFGSDNLQSAPNDSEKEIVIRPAVA